ncbi:ABC transporter permease [Brevundimonas sp. R86498]|uniref:ABC transporter permease n=1 Tax=Brevundimonas sp. R86498 TaxID=3093845 RepID=UPI0037C5A648
MRRALRIAAEELRLMTRTRTAWLGLAALVLLSAIAAATSAAHIASERAAREEHQAAADHAFEAQPDRHPHRAVHFGTYVQRPVSPLAAFEPGVDPFTGTTLFLEGHRQNTATFGAMRESSGLIRFGQLTPAFVLQALAPLLLIFLGFSAVARERETGVLKQLRVHGARAGDVLAGKALALGTIGLVALAPALVSLATAAASAPAEAASAALIGGAYAVYLTIWILVVVAVSSLSRSSRGALLGLIAVWTVSVVLVPRGTAALATWAKPAPTRVEMDLRLAQDARRIGDSHNPDDPFFAAFKARTLSTYGVQRVEDLPVNFRGLVSAEGEALTAGLFAEYAKRTADQQRAQSAWLKAGAVLSPALAVRQASMAGAATDLENHVRFLEQAEAHRFDLVQRLNRLHAEGVQAGDDAARSSDLDAERRTRVSAKNWAAVPDFHFRSATPAERAGAMIAGLAGLAGWLLAAIGLFVFAGLRLRESSK